MPYNLVSNMNCAIVLVFCIVFSQSCCITNKTFPPGFLFGVATAAYQVEGAWNVSDKGESMWDRLVHTQPSLVADGSNGDVACDSYHLWKRDIEMALELGVNSYRFSISWPRILPSGYPDHISKDGTAYYNNLIDGLLDVGIEPMVTIYHFDLPQSLQDLGGWANPLVSDWFADYARVVFSLYADRVKIWLTINEPVAICDGGYSKLWAPYYEDLKVGMFLCNKHVLVAHAKAYRIYDQEFRHLYHGKLSIPNINAWLEPETPEDAEVTELMFQMREGRFSYPIYSKKGGWPPTLEKILNENSRKEGYSHPRLPPFTEDEIELVRGTYDFYALNYYISRLVRKVDRQLAGSWLLYGSEEIGADMVSDPSWRTSVFDWFGIYPQGLRKQLHWINSTYGVSEVLITENGLPSTSKDLYDYSRLEYMRTHLEQVLLAIDDGLSVMGYTAWALMDNFEWLAGNSINFGLYAVDFSSPQRTRTPRESARYYSSVTRTRSLGPVHRPLYYD